MSVEWVFVTTMLVLAVTISLVAMREAVDSSIDDAASVISVAE